MFIKNNQSFICVNCGHKVPKHPHSSRDHCNKCLYSLHVDIEPGDRKNDCLGLLEPIGVIVKSKKTQIVYRCLSCGAVVKNITAPDDDVDNLIRVAQTPQNASNG